MPRIEYEIKKPILPIVFMIEASDNMAGYRIAAVNVAMQEFKDILVENVSFHPDVNIKVAAIKYGDNAELLTNGFECLHRFEWKDIEAAGKSNIGAAIDLLNNKLLKDKVITKDANTTAFFRPIVFFLSASPSTDDYLAALSNADKNKNFHFSRRFSVVIGCEADKEMLVNICGTDEAIFSGNDLKSLKQLLVAIEMPEGEMIDDFICEDSVSEFSEDLSSIVKVDEIKNQDNFYLKGTNGTSVSVNGSTDVVRCQWGPCEPEEANDVVFHIDDDEDHLILTNSGNIKDLYVSFRVERNDKRIIVGCCKSFFAISSDSKSLDSSVILEIVENGIKISNNSSSDVIVKVLIDAGTCTHLLNNDIIQNANDNSLTVVRNKYVENIEGMSGGFIPPRPALTGDLDWM